jgi:hypothetical protein
MMARILTVFCWAALGLSFVAANCVFQGTNIGIRVKSQRGGGGVALLTRACYRMERYAP